MGSPSVVPDPVRLHRVHLVGAQPRAGQRRPDHPLLRRAVRRGQPVGAPRPGSARCRGSPPAPGARSGARPTAAPPPARPRPRPTRSRPRPRRTTCTARRRTCRPAGRSPRTARGGQHRHAAGQRQVHSPDRSAWQARCSATSEDEHAVSTVTAGPSRPRVKATRPDSTLVAAPVSRYPSEHRRTPTSNARRRTPRSGCRAAPPGRCPPAPSPPSTPPAAAAAAGPWPAPPAG